MTSEWHEDEIHKLVLVEASDLIADLHMHTLESDGKGTLEQMVDPKGLTDEQVDAHA